MRKHNWLLLIVGLVACGLIAAGCGDSGDDSSSDDSSTAIESTTSSTESTTSEDTSTDESTTTDDTSTEETTSTDSSSGGSVDVDEFVDRCVDALSGQGASESQAQEGCEQASEAIKACIDQAGDAGSAVCQQIADEAIKQLQAGG